MVAQMLLGRYMILKRAPGVATPLSIILSTLWTNRSTYPMLSHRVTCHKRELADWVGLYLRCISTLTGAIHSMSLAASSHRASPILREVWDHHILSGESHPIP